MVAGEPSGDTYGAQVIHRLRERDPELYFFGIGGREMERAGVKLLGRCEEMAVVGIVEAVGKLPKVIKVWRRLKRAIELLKPKLSILIDYPGFNLRLARELKGRGVPVLYYVSPQLWAWWPQRAKEFRKGIDQLAVILPFEVDFFRRYGIEATFVGHPQREVIKEAPSRGEARRLLGVQPGERVIGLFPGSREGELKRHIGPMVGAVKILREQVPGLRFFLALASGLEPPRLDPVGIEVLQGEALKVMAASDLLLAASGTVTLQGALMGIPMVVIYRVNPLSYWLGKRIVRVSFISLPNLLLGEGLLPELIQQDVSPWRIATEAKGLLLDRERRERIREGFRRIRELLPEGAPDRVADMAIKLMEG